MKRKWAILSCILAFALLSGCGVELLSENPTEGRSADYKVGYQNGFEAAANSAEAVAAGMRGELFYTPSELPNDALKKIQDEPLEYQHGFTAGWK
ncbi:MAG: hypothetical protein OXU51_09770, partial [Candidatus Poribacteria bacterium]|nr:hypothetical protein [Candidatus Poribacteria bacterium]